MNHDVSSLRRQAAVCTTKITVMAILAASFAPRLHASIVLDFDSLDALASGLNGLTGAPVDNYFASFGITVSGDPFAVFDVRNFVDQGVEFTAPASRTNFVGGTTSPATTTVQFANTLDSMSFTRNALIVTGPGGTTHPQWSAAAYDSGGNQLDSVGEPLIATFTDVPLKTFTLSGPNIAWVTFDSDNQNFAGYGAVIFDDLTLESSVPEPSMLVIGGVLTALYTSVHVGRRLIGTLH